MADIKDFDNSWRELLEDATSCTKCSLSESRTNCVFGRGNKNADVFFIGEAPGANEDRLGIPFVGRSGKLLEALLAEAGFSPESFYIANVLKCRPPENRDPKPYEEDLCLPFLYKQIELVSPKLIVCVGRISAKRLIGKDFKITEDHGKWFMHNGTYITAVYHPALVLRNISKKDDLLSDLKLIKEKTDQITKRTLL